MHSEHVKVCAKMRTKLTSEVRDNIQKLKVCWSFLLSLSLWFSSSSLHSTVSYYLIYHYRCVSIDLLHILHQIYMVPLFIICLRICLSFLWFPWPPDMPQLCPSASYTVLFSLSSSSLLKIQKLCRWESIMKLPQKFTLTQQLIWYLKVDKNRGPYVLMPRLFSVEWVVMAMNVELEGMVGTVITHFKTH
jgi:hypothetical protein